MQTFADKIIGFVELASPIATAVTIVGLFMTGIMIGGVFGDNAKAKARENIIWIVIGAAVMLGAVEIGRWITSSL